VKVTNNDTQDLPFRRVFRNADRILTILAASSCQKSDTRNGANAKSFYHGLFSGWGHLRGRKLSRNDSFSDAAISKHIVAARASAVHLCHGETGRKKKSDANGQYCKPSNHDAYQSRHPSAARGAWQLSFKPPSPFLMHIRAGVWMRERRHARPGIPGRRRSNWACRPCTG
jgi:hypothetical protein